MGDLQHDEIARLREEIEAMRGRTGSCAECERLTAELEPLHMVPMASVEQVLTLVGLVRDVVFVIDSHPGCSARSNIVYALKKLERDLQDRFDAATRDQPEVGDDGILREFIQWADDETTEGQLDSGLLAMKELCRRALGQGGHRG